MSLKSNLHVGLETGLVEILWLSPDLRYLHGVKPGITGQLLYLTNMHDVCVKHLNFRGS